MSKRVGPVHLFKRELNILVFQNYNMSKKQTNKANIKEQGWYSPPKCRTHFSERSCSNNVRMRAATDNSHSIFCVTGFLLMI